jgi:hypothetical protein
MTKEQIILFIFFYLIANNNWKIITILIFIYLFYKIDDPAKNNISIEVKTFNEAINDVNFLEAKNFYYKKFLNLEKLKGRYPIALIRHEQIKTINGMLLQIPLNDTMQNKWLMIRNYLQKEI